MSLKSDDVNAMIDELVWYKKTRYPNDRRVILSCSVAKGMVEVEWGWLPPSPEQTSRGKRIPRVGERSGLLALLGGRWRGPTGDDGRAGVTLV